MRILQVVGYKIFAVFIDDRVHIKVGEVKLIAVIEEKLGNIRWICTCDCR